MELREIKGKPPLKPGIKTGYFLWNDDKGIHLLWTTKGRMHGFRGKITGEKPLVIKKMEQLESNDEILQPDPNTITWTTRTKGDIDGFLFEAEGDFTLDLGIDTIKIGANQIFCGRSMRKAPRNPFTIKLK